MSKLCVNYSLKKEKASSYIMQEKHDEQSS